MDPRDFTRTQRALQPLPILERQQVGVRLAESQALGAIAYAQADLDLLGQEDHARLEEPVWYVFLAIAAVAVGANLDVREGLHGIVVVQVDLEITADTVVTDVEIPVEDVGRGIVADAEPEIDHGANRPVLGRGLEEYVERRQLALRDQVLEYQRLALQLYAVGRRLEQLAGKRILEPSALQLEVVVDDVVEHAAGAIDLVHPLVLAEDGGHTLERLPLVATGRAVANHLEHIVRMRRRESDGHRAGAAHRHREPLAVAQQAPADLVYHCHFAEMVVADRRVVQSEGAARHDAAQEAGELVIVRVGHLKRRLGRAAEVVDVRHHVQHRLCANAFG